MYYIFNAEGDDDRKTDKFGKGPMATQCAFWNKFLPRLRSWSGIYRKFRVFLYDLFNYSI